MFDSSSIYAKNKLDPNAIVYPGEMSSVIRITRNDFSSEEEFLYWKDISDRLYHYEDQADVQEQRHTVSLEAVPEAVVSTEGPETLLLEKLKRIERGKLSSHVTESLRKVLTRKQFHRLWCFGVDGMTHRAIAEKEHVTYQAITKSLGLVKKKIKKFYVLEKTGLPKRSNSDV